MIQELFQLYADRWQFFLKLTLQHLEISLIAIVAALCIGLSLGILISSYRRSSSLVLGLTNFMYTIPSIALFGFLMNMTNTLLCIHILTGGVLQRFRQAGKR